MVDHPFNDLSDDDLVAEYLKWDREVRGATLWGAALGAADSFRKRCRRVLERRGIPIPDGEPVEVKPSSDLDVARAISAAYLRGLKEAAEIALAARSEAALERRKLDTADGEAKACWLWAFDTANGIERDIRALLTAAAEEIET